MLTLASYYSVSRIYEVHLGCVWVKVKGKRGKIVPHSSEKRYKLNNVAYLSNKLQNNTIRSYYLLLITYYLLLITYYLLLITY